MISSSPIISSSALSVLVLLPESMENGGQRLSPAARAAGPSNTVSTPRVAANTGNAQDYLDADIDPLLVQSRRLSLGVGLGAGIRMSAHGSSSNPSLPFSPPSPSSTPHHIGTTKTGPIGVRETRAAEFGTKHFPAGGPKSPTTSADDAAAAAARAQAALRAPRGSVAVPSGVGMMSSATGRRVGIEGDELVGSLRQSGLEVTAVRHNAHLPGILSEPQATPTVPQLSASRELPQPAQQVVLVPLGDTPSLPSLSLLLSRGTTPSAVCFQQDLLDRAAKIEGDWINAATASIQRVQELIKPGFNAAVSGETPLVVGYVSHGTLSPAAVQACIAAGASGVLHPPYDAHTALVLNQLVTARKAGKTDTVANLSTSPSHPNLSMGGSFDDDTNVVLTPTALSMGAEHESEKVLSAFTHHRRRLSAHLNLSRVVTPGSNGSIHGEPHPDRDALKTGTTTSSVGQTVATPGSTTLAHFPALAHIYDQTNLTAVTSAEARRRSVDTGGIALAFNRASQRMIPADMAGDPSMHSPNRNGSDAMVAGDKEQEAADAHTTQFAEVLGDVHEQTMASINIQMGEYETLAAPMTREDRVRIVNALREWDFRPHLLSPTDLFRIPCMIFEVILHTEGLSDLGIEQDRVNRLLFAIRAIYHAPNPYHNYVHAIDVLQATYFFLVRIGVAPPFDFFLELERGTSVWRRPSEETLPPAGSGTSRARSILRPQDVLAVLVAAMGHDVGHPGLSNAFMKNAKVPLAVVYDDKSVLENMHCMLIVHLLRKHGFGFLFGTPSVAEVKAYPARAAIDARSFRSVLYSAILATDMALHFAWIQRLKDYAEAMQSDHPADRSAMAEEDRVVLCQALIKCADISNPTRPIDVSEHWSTVLLDEWTKQASLEEELSLPVSVVSGVDARGQAKGQVGFIDLFTAPLFKATADAIPEMRAYADSCMTNRSIWQSRLERLDADEEINAARTAALHSHIARPPTPSRQDERFNTLFPLILPSTLVTTTYPPDSPTHTSPPHSPTSSPRIHTGPAAHAAVRVVYRDEVHDRSMLARHVLALTGFDTLHGARRMSTPEVLLGQSRLQETS